MSRPTKWREQFIADMARRGQSVELARKFLRIGATLQRLAEAQCNGDYPADNGECNVVECDQCRSLWVPSCMHRPLTERLLARKGGMARAVFEGLAVVECPAPGFSNARPILICPDCVATERAKKLVPAGWKLNVQGDPRGCILTLVDPDGREVGVP